MFQNCTTCSRYLRCKDPAKQASYKCGKYTSYTEELDDIFGKKVDQIHDPKYLGKEFKSWEDDEKQADDLQAMLEESLNPNNVIPPDLKIDDRDIPQAPNFFSFCMEKDGINTPPTAKQLVIFTHLFSEFCPHCTFDEFTIYDFPVNYPVQYAEEDITFLRYGVCPKCNARKSELIRDGLLASPQELALVCGQRCVTGDTLILTEDGMVAIGDYDNNRPFGYTPLHKRVATRDGQAHTSRFYKAKPEILKRVHLYGGHSITGTTDHPLMTEDKFVKMGHLSVGDHVEIRYGQHLYGSTIGDFREISQLAEQDLLALKAQSKSGFNMKMPIVWPGNNLSKKRYIDEDIARLMGFWVSEGFSTSITNRDQKILDHCETTFKSIVDNRSVRRTDIVVKTHDATWLRCWLSRLMGQDVYTTRSATKEIPYYIRTAPGHIVAAFMEALFEGDGGIEGSAVTYCTISKKLAHQLQTMLLNMGIPCRLHKGWSWATNGTENQVSKRKYTIRIEGVFALQAFKREIGFFSTRKKNALEGAIRLNDRSLAIPCYYERLPEYFRDRMVALIARIKTELKEYPRFDRQTGKSRKSGLGMDTVFGRDARIERFYRLNSISKREILRVAKLLEPWMDNLSDQAKLELDYLVTVAKDTRYYERIRKIKDTKKPIVTYDITVPDGHNFIANGILNHNSGKSLGTTLALAYIIHWFLKLQNPNRVYRQTDNTFFTMTLVAQTFAKAKELLYVPVVNILHKAPWFTAYHEMLDHYQDVYGEELYNIGKDFTQYHHRSLYIHPMNPNKTTLRGSTRFATAIDELGWFAYGDGSEDAVRANGAEVYESVDKSLLTIRAAYDELLEEGYDNVPNAWGIYPSSPQARNDQIMTLLRKFEGSDLAISAQLATWDMNPRITRKTKAIVKAFLANPIKAMRDYGAEPPLSENPYIDDPTEYLTNFKKNKNLLGRYKYKTNTNSSHLRRYAKFLKLDSFQGPTVMAIDAGYSNNSFAIVIGRIHPKTNRVQIIGMMEIAPSRGKPLDYALIYKHVIIPIIIAFKVVRVYIDRWQSTKIQHDIEHDTAVDGGEMTEAVQYSLKRGDFDTVLDYWNDPLTTPHFPILEMPYESDDKSLVTIKTIDVARYPHCFKYKPVSHFLFQVSTVTETRKTVDKGEGYTDDLFRAAILLMHALYDKEVVEWLKTKRDGRGSFGPKKAMFSSRLLSSGAQASSGGATMTNDKKMAISSRALTTGATHK